MQDLKGSAALVPQGAARAELSLGAERRTEPSSFSSHSVIPEAPTAKPLCQFCHHTVGMDSGLVPG